MNVFLQLKNIVKEIMKMKLKREVEDERADGEEEKSSDSDNNDHHPLLIKYLVIWWGRNG